MLGDDKCSQRGPNLVSLENCANGGSAGSADEEHQQQDVREHAERRITNKTFITTVKIHSAAIPVPTGGSVAAAPAVER